MHNNSGGGPAWRQQQPMHHQNQFGGGHPDAHMMAILQKQQRQYYQQQQQGQGMWNPGVNQMFSGVDHSMQNGNFMMQPYRFFGHSRGVMYPLQQQQQRFGHDSNANPNAPQRPGWAESRPGRTPCEKNWWSHVVSEMRVVDSPRGLDLDVEDENANVMEELRKSGSKAGTGADKEVELASPGFPDVFDSPKGAGEALGLTPTPVPGQKPAAVAGGCTQESAEAAWRVESPHPLCILQQMQASAPSRGSEVPPPREQQQQQPPLDVEAHPQRHLCNGSDYPASKDVGRSQFAEGIGSRAAASSPPEAASRRDGQLSSDGHAIARSLSRQVLDNSKGEQGEEAAGNKCRSAGSCSMHRKDETGAVTGMPSVLRKGQSESDPHAEGEQQEQSKAVLRCANTPCGGIGERQGPPKPPRVSRKLPRPGKSFSYSSIPDGLDEDDTKDVAWDNASDQYSGSDGSDSSLSSVSDNDDSDGSDSDDEAEYSAIRRSSQSGIGGQSTLEYSAFHDAPVAHARHSIIPLVNHAVGHHSTGSFLGAGKAGQSLYLGASASNALIDVPLISVLGQPQKTAAGNASARDDVVSFPIDLGEAYALSSNTITVSGSVAVPGNSITTTAEIACLDRSGDEMSTLVMARVVPEHAGWASPVGAAEGALSGRMCTVPTATKSLPTAAAKRSEEAPKLPRQVADARKSTALSVGAPRGSSSANDANASSKAAVTRFPGVCRGSQRERFKSGDAAAERRLAKRVLRDLDSSHVASSTYKGESSLSEPLDSRLTAASTTGKAERTTPPATGVAPAIAAKGAAARTTTSASTTASEGATPTVTASTPTEVKARRLPIIRSTQLVPSAPVNSPGSAQVQKSHGKRPSPFQHMCSAAQPTPGVAPPRLYKAKASATVVHSQSSTESRPPLSVTASTVPTHPATDPSPSTNACGPASAATAAAAVTALKPVAQSSSLSPASDVPARAAALTLTVAGEKAAAGPSSITATETVASTTSSDGALSALRSSGNRPHRAAAPLPGNSLSASSKPHPRSTPAAASPAAAHHCSQPQPPSAGSLKKKSVAEKDLLETKGGAVLARATPPDKTAGSASESSAAEGAPKRLSILLLSDPPLTPTGATAAATSVTRTAAAAVTVRPSSVVDDTIPISAVEGTATPSGAETRLTTAHSAPEKPTASGTCKVVVASASGDTLKHPVPGSPEKSNATDSLKNGRSAPLSTLGLAMKPKTTAAAAAAPPVISEPASHASGDDEGGSWPEDPYGCYDYIEPDLRGSNSHNAAKPSTAKVPVSNRAVHRYSMVGSLAISPLSTSGNIGKMDAASGACAKRRQSSEPDVLQEMGYMYY
ncbi:hypothetical protein GH5_06017 [Leishmania sp. Ghana 2012 LV757]|uniref:hypothetical protein n=1 Tax=Leishmania sp. Ghana 2012 LV757 TaxID=2803181 RepID=UPI001B66FD40|nr:hypothetical protein GH5_06017 [Leishmania sp. Ghana 2012 LV757]